jgi:hypothetical protein
VFELIENYEVEATSGPIATPRIWQQFRPSVLVSAGSGHSVEANVE